VDVFQIADAIFETAGRVEVPQLPTIAAEDDIGVFVNAAAEDFNEADRLEGNLLFGGS
jgi:hypothetical protein